MATTFSNLGINSMISGVRWVSHMGKNGSEDTGLDTKGLGFLGHWEDLCRW